MIHTGWGSRVEPVGKLAKKFKKGTFIIAHAKEDTDLYNFERFDVLTNNLNVYLELSFYQLSKRIKDFAERFEDRLLFGSDFITHGYEKNISCQVLGIKVAGINEEIEKKIFYKNALKLLE